MPTWSTALLAARRGLATFDRIPRPVREELAQEAILRVFQAPGVADRVALARTAARHLAIDWLRRRREVYGPHEEAGSSAWQRRVEARIDATRVLRSLQEAPRGYQEVVQLFWLEQLDVGQIVAHERGDQEPAQLVRDRVYQRRRRALAWARRRLGVQ